MLRLEYKIYTLFNNSLSVIYLKKSHIFYMRTKYIYIKYYFICFLLEIKMYLEKIHTSVNPGNMLMKVIPPYKLKLCASLVGLR